jgi:hypothetical protein
MTNKLEENIGKKLKRWRNCHQRTRIYKRINEEVGHGGSCL